MFKKIIFTVILLTLMISTINFIFAGNIQQETENNYTELINNIPFSKGKVFETNIINNEKPDIIIINDIHCQQDAQNNIYSIIKYFNSNINIDKILTEGASKGKVNTSSITDIDSKTKDKILTQMLNKGLVNGTEYFCYTTNKELYGIEDSVIYMETLQQAYSLIKNENYFTTKLNKANKNLEKLKKKHYTTDMFEFEKIFFNKNKIESKDYCNLLSTFMEKYSIDYNEYKEVYTFINIVKCDNTLSNYTKYYNTDFDKLLQKLRNYAPSKNYINFINEYKDKNIEERLIDCYKQTKHFLNTKEKEYYSYIDLIETKNNLLKTFNIEKYLKEEKFLYSDIFNKLFIEQKTKDIAFINQMLFLTDKYIKLNIDFYSFDTFINNKDKFIFLLKETEFITNKEDIINLLNNEELNKYYDNNIKRDEIFFNNTNELIKENTTNILVVGGFHKQLLKLFADNNKKYIVVFPNTNSTDNNLYKQIIIDIGSYNFLSKQ